MAIVAVAGDSACNRVGPIAPRGEAVKRDAW
jgi:hypothetical protein